MGRSAALTRAKQSDARDMSLELASSKVTMSGRCAGTATVLSALVPVFGVVEVAAEAVVVRLLSQHISLEVEI